MTCSFHWRSAGTGLNSVDLLGSRSERVCIRDSLILVLRLGAVNLRLVVWLDCLVRRCLLDSLLLSVEITYHSLRLATVFDAE